VKISTLLQKALVPLLALLLSACGAGGQAAPRLPPEAPAAATIQANLPLMLTAPPSATVAPPATADMPPTATIAGPAQPPTATYEVLNSYPHDPGAFTQGLVYEDGWLYEGTGLNGRSTLRKVVLDTGEVVQSHELDDSYFGEGITIFGDKIYQITWQSQIGFVYEKASFTQVGEFHYPSEGWGITHDGAQLIMSDGSATLHFLDPQTLQEISTISVTDNNGPVLRLNELEYVNGEIYANIWQTDRIARISPETGQVLGWIDLTGLLSAEDRQQTVDVLNGIAYDAASNRLFVTGKLWPKLFEIRIVN
jgi:glutamine cyclotransferase